MSKKSKATTKLVIISRLHVLRAERRITQAQLAEKVEVTRATIVAIEGGNYNPSLELAFRIARFFQVSIEDIFSVEGEQ